MNSVVKGSLMLGALLSTMSAARSAHAQPFPATTYRALVASEAVDAMVTGP